MKGRNLHVRFLGFLILGSLSLGAFDATYADTCIGDQLGLNHDIVLFNRFKTTRGMSDYIRRIGKYFWRDLKRLPAEAHWVDMGAGKAEAMFEAVTVSHLEVRVRNLTAVGYSKPPGAHEAIQGANFRYLDGQYLEDIPLSKIGKADLITDLYGPFSYTAAPDVVLRKYMDVLKPGGVAYIFLNTDDLTIDNFVHGLSEYFHSIRGAKASWEGAHFRGQNCIRIEKTSEDYSVPTLYLQDFKAAAHSDEGKGNPARKYTRHKP